MRDPLISVIVITYNSAAYVIETLDSIKVQTYPNIELIIADDASADNTVGVCRAWIKENEARFSGIHLVTAEKNAGIPANCNRGFKVATGRWIKLIAGDDALYPFAVEQAVAFIQADPVMRIFASKTTYFQNTFANESIVQQRDDSANTFFNADAKRQYFLLLRNNCIHGGSVFIKRDLLKELNGFNEKYFYLEDHPFWLAVTKLGEKIYYMPQLTVKYRLHDYSVFSSEKKEALFNNFYKKKRSFELDMIYPNIRWFEKLGLTYDYYLKALFDATKMNRKETFFTTLFEVFKALSPNSIMRLVHKRRIV